jgi:riboflavin kinase/FMN adenylyltransferase
VASLSAETFLVEMLVNSLKIDTLVIGADARVGKGGAGTAPIIQEIMQKHGAKVLIQEFEHTEGAKVGSREIRQFISEGKVEAANLLLGRPFAIEGIIQHGAGRGSTIGIPTANINTTRQILPQGGVYATQTLLRGVLCPSITNIGIRPTFGGSQIVVESHLLGYSGGDFYNSRVEVAFLKKIREERKFGSPAELVAQIRVDIDAARAFHATL